MGTAGHCRGLLEIWFLLGDSGTTDFALDWKLSGNRGKSVMGGWGEVLGHLSRMWEDQSKASPGKAEQSPLLARGGERVLVSVLRTSGHR